MSRYFWSNKEQIINEVFQPLFKLGLSVNKVCRYTGIAQSTVQSWIESDDSLRLKISMWRSEVSLKARHNIVSIILDPTADNLKLSMWWLKNTEPDEFNTSKSFGKVESFESLSYKDLLYLQELHTSLPGTPIK